MPAGGSRRQALRYVAVCVALAVIHTLVAVKVSYAQKHFSTALSEKNRGEVLPATKQQQLTWPLAASHSSLLTAAVRMGM
jgi:hypothetical protein